MTATPTLKGPLDMMQFDSSNLRSGLYDSGVMDLYIRFHGDPTDRIYLYQFVPQQIWEGLKSASSHGSYHAEHIKWRFPYEQLSSSDWPQQGRSTTEAAFLKA
ncbi:KTSC domain-containing protein [Halomarina rubra]|uniref:KTSC domain-containing protein n=1 Tax=Halomarina rubra TaxID=2071873 RepID=A0ABD6ARG9_9EURY|nr:KTSC domain-containing protein [Halomarina rubra]